MVPQGHRRANESLDPDYTFLSNELRMKQDKSFWENERLFVLRIDYLKVDSKLSIYSLRLSYLHFKIFFTGRILMKYTSSSRYDFSI